MLQDLKDRQFGRLKVLKRTGSDSHHNRLWECLCACGNTVFKPTSSLTTGHVTSCGCLKKEKSSKSLKWKGHGLISSKMWSGIKHNAEARNHKLLITIEDIWKIYEDQQGKCALSGVDINFRESKYSIPGTASLDRIDSSKDYTIDNVQWIHKTLNMMKNKLAEEEFVSWCAKVCETALNAGRLY